jgi:acetylglutamate kinase
MRTLVLKLGGELLESATDRSRIAAFAAGVVRERPLVLVHGGGRAVDAELARRAITPRKVDGLRITDAETLDAVVAVLAGSANTDLVAALVASGVSGVGLTGVDAGLGRAVRTNAYTSTSGAIVDLGRVGDPVDAQPDLIELLVTHRYVPVVASLGIDAEGGAVLNVNADVMACRIASALGRCDLVIAGGTPGVLDARGDSIDRLDPDGIDRLIAGGTATAGMVAKLASCQAALAAGVASIRLVDGRTLDGTHGIEMAPGTTLVPGRQVAAGPREPAEQRWRQHRRT